MRKEICFSRYRGATTKRVSGFPTVNRLIGLSGYPLLITADAMAYWVTHLRRQGQALQDYDPTKLHSQQRGVSDVFLDAVSIHVYALNRLTNTEFLRKMNVREQVFVAEQQV